MRQILPWQRILFLALAVLMTTGCALQGLKKSERLKDAAHGINEEARWNRLDLAKQRVVPGYRAVYTALHKRWGKSIQIADQDVTGLSIDEDKEKGYSLVSISWYDMDDMTLRSSVVKQTWSQSGRAYYLSAEKVIEGDTTIFEDVEDVAQPPKVVKPAKADAKTSEDDDFTSATNVDWNEP